MSKLILSSGERTNKPYGFPSMGVRVYSMEELCYYLYHHVYMIEEDMLCDDLFDWIETELKLPDRANKLKQLKRQNAGVKTIVTVILCSADYYTEYEIKSMLKLLDEVIGLSYIKRNCLKANNCFRHKQYIEAATMYEKLILSREATELSPEEYGDLYHNLAVAKAHLTGFKEASRLFCQAYELNHKEESLKQYLYTLHLSNNQSGYMDKIEEYQVSEDMKDNIMDFLNQAQEEAQCSDMMKEMEHLKHKKAIGKISEYYEQTDKIIDFWKTQIRQI